MSQSVISQQIVRLTFLQVFLNSTKWRDIKSKMKEKEKKNQKIHPGTEIVLETLILI